MNRTVLAGLAVLALAGSALAWRAAPPAAPAPGLAAEAPVPVRPPRAAVTPGVAGVVVYVAGAVNRPGVYRLGSGRRVVDALREAGEPKAGADLVAVNLAEPLRDGEEVVVPLAGERAAAPRRSGGAARASSGRSRHARGGRKRSQPPAAPIDLNAADAAALATLPGVGRGLADRIVAFRAANGPFDSVDELADVSGITDRRLEELSPYLTVGGRP